MKLPILQSKDEIFQLMQTKWASILNVLLGNPSLQSMILSNVSLKNGTTTINHLLDRKLIGWRVIGINGSATIYDQQRLNQTPDKTLILVSNAAVLINLEVF